MTGAGVRSSPANVSNRTSGSKVRSGRFTNKASPQAIQRPAFAPGHPRSLGRNRNGSHYRRDVSLGEGASGISGSSGTYVMATLRNLLLGLMELQRHHGKTQTRTFPGWRRNLTVTQKIQLVT